MKRAALVVCLLAIVFIARTVSALELVVQIDSGPETPPKNLCIAADPNLAIHQSARCPTELPKDMLPIHLELSPTPNANINSVEIAGGGFFRIQLAPRAPPAVITVFSEHKCAVRHRSERVRWLPSMGTAPVVLAVVPAQVDRAIEYPEYTCQEGQANAPGLRPFEIDREWKITKPPPISACKGQLQFRPRGTVQSIRSKTPVPFEVSKFDFSWLVHPLFECRGADAAVRIAASENNLHCGAAKFVDEPGGARYVWTGCTATTFPGRVTLKAACPPYASDGRLLEPTPRWTETLQYPGQTLSNYTRDEERSVIVRWDGWGGPTPSPGAPGWVMQPWLADRAQDRIETVVLRDVGGHELHLSPPASRNEAGLLTASGARLLRVAVPGVQVGQYFVAQFVGDRVFANESLEVGPCGLAEHEAKSRPIGNCVVLGKPTKRRDAVTLGLRVGAGLGTANPVGPHSHFFSPTGELGLHVLVRAEDKPVDYEVSAVLLAQRWKSYRQNLVEGDRISVQEAAPLLVFGLEPGVRFRWDSFSWGVSMLAGWGGPALRGTVSTVSDQVVVGGGLALGYAWSRTVALELRPRFLLAEVSSIAMDAGGLTDFEPSRATWVLQIPLVARFDDIVGD